MTNSWKFGKVNTIFEVKLSSNDHSWHNLGQQIEEGSEVSVISKSCSSLWRPAYVTRLYITNVWLMYHYGEKVISRALNGTKYSSMGQVKFVEDIL